VPKVITPHAAGDAMIAAAAATALMRQPAETATHGHAGNIIRGGVTSQPVQAAAK